MGVSFNIETWAAWAPGLDSQEAWRAWARAPRLPQGSDTPALTEMPAMARRRIGRLGRIALQAAYRVVEDASHPLVFASRHGDLTRTTAMLRELALDGSVSPAAFSLSVHNAIGALFSIARGDTARLSAVSAGIDTAENAIIEACGLLADGADKVILVMYDEAPPSVYAPYQDEPDADYAWALRLTRQGTNMFSLGCEDEREPAFNACPQLPRGLQTLRFLLSGDSCMRLPSARHLWQWQHHT